MRKVMKRLTNFFWTIAFTSAIFTSCAKQQEIEIVSEEEVSPVEMVTFTFDAIKAGEETKTQAILDDVNNKVSYEWTDEDVSNMKLFLVSGKTITEVASPTITKVSATKLTISCSVPAAETYTFRAILAREYYAKGKPMINKYQSPEEDSFDPKGDILFSDDKVVTTDGTSSGDMLLTFNRKVSVNQMTLKELGTGELVSKVEITSDKDLVGYYDGSDIVALGDSKSIVLSFDNKAVSAEGQFPVFFTCMPNTGNTLTVIVTTDTHVYTKTFGSTIDFALGSFFRFGAKMATNSTITDSSVSTWDLVTESSGALSDGDIILIASSGGSYVMGEDNGNNRAAITAVPLNEGSQMTYNPDFQEITLEEDGTSGNYYLKVGDDSYLYAASSSKNYLKTASKTTAGTNGVFSISVDAGGVASIEAKGANTNNKLKKNTSNDLFSCYSSGQTGVSVYRRSAGDATVWNLKSISVTTQPTKKSGYETGDQFNPDGMVVIATYEDNAGTKDDKQETLDNADLTISPVTLCPADTKVTLTYRNKNVDVSGLSVSKKTPTIVATPSEATITAYPGGTLQIKITSDGGSDGAITYESDDEDIATVSSTGLVTSVAAGTATITIHTAATSDYNEGTTSVEITVASEKYSVIKSIGDITAGTYYMGSNNETTFAGSTSIQLWTGAVSSNKLSKLTATWDTSTCDFSTITGAASVTLEAGSGTNVWRIKVGTKYLKASGTTFSLSDDSFDWTFENRGSYEGVDFYNTSSGTYVSCNSASDVGRAYDGSGKKYKGIYFFKEN